MHLLQVNIKFYDTVNMIHDIITIANPFNSVGRNDNFLAKAKQEGHDGPEIAHLSLLTKHAPSSFPVT